MCAISTYPSMDPANNATSSQAMPNPSNAQQFPPPPPLCPTGFMHQNPVDCNIMGNINFPSPGQGPTTMWAPIQPRNTSSQSTMIPASQSALYWNHYMNFEEPSWFSWSESIHRFLSCITYKYTVAGFEHYTSIACKLGVRC
jgi:hypothetical protein